MAGYTPPDSADFLCRLMKASPPISPLLSEVRHSAMTGTALWKRVSEDKEKYCPLSILDAECSEKDSLQSRVRLTLFFSDGKGIQLQKAVFPDHRRYDTDKKRYKND